VIPQEPDIKARQRAASLEVPDVPNPIPPTPLVFKKRKSQPLLAILPLVMVALVILFATNPVVAAGLAITYLATGIAFQARSKSRARVEIIGSTIREYGPKGELYIEEDLRNIKTLISRQAQKSPTYYYVLFPGPKILTFDTDRDFQLMKILQNWGCQKFEEVDIHNKVGLDMLAQVNERIALPDSK
jgi:hypothetical protein